MQWVVPCQYYSLSVWDCAFNCCFLKSSILITEHRNKEIHNKMIICLVVKLWYIPKAWVHSWWEEERFWACCLRYLLLEDYSDENCIHLLRRDGGPNIHPNLELGNAAAVPYSCSSRLRMQVASLAIIYY